jgi:pentatricopeptide repeat protein
VSHSTTTTTAPKSFSRNNNSTLSLVHHKRRHSKSYLERQSAILELQQTSQSHLDSALARLGGMLKVQDLNAVLRSFGKLNRWHDLSQLFEWMQQNGKINASSYSSYMKFMGKNLNPVKAMEIFNGIKDESAKKNIFICNSVLSCLVRNGKFDSSIKLFRQMKQNGLMPDAVTYSTLLAGCIKVKHGYSKALELVRELQHNGLHMDSVIYGTLLAVCASNNKLEEAESYFNQMKDEGHSPNVFHYSSLLNAYSINGNYKKADELVQDMKSAGLVPNKVCFHV